MQQQVNSCNTNSTAGWTCPSIPPGINYDVFPATLPVQRTLAFCMNCDRTEHFASSDCIVPENVQHKDQVRAAWYAPSPARFGGVELDEQVRVVSLADTRGPSRPVIVLTTLEIPALDCTETFFSIHVLVSAEQKSRPLTLSQVKEDTK